LRDYEKEDLSKIDKKSLSRRWREKPFANYLVCAREEGYCAWRFAKQAFSVLLLP
jgi:hypothetical protein